jgi:ribokinase
VNVAVLASFNMDLVMRSERLPRRGETLQGAFEMFLGGKGFNQAVAARRLGADVSVIGRVGDDDFGQAFVAALDEEGINRDYVIVEPGEGTGVAIVHVLPDGENAIIQAPRVNTTITAPHIRAAAGILNASDVALFQLETSIPAATEFARLARERDVRLMFNPAPAIPVTDELIQLADVVVLNEIEAMGLTAIVPDTMARAYEAADLIQRRAEADVVLTRSRQGALAMTERGRVDVPAFRVPVVDTVGAGDAFVGALAVALAEEMPMLDAMRFAAAAGAIAVTRPGAEPSMPARDEVEQLLASGRTLARSLV